MCSPWRAWSELREPELDLVLRRLVGVRSVNEVERDLDREIAADRAGSGLERVGRADHLARRGDGVCAFEHHRDEGTAGDERDQLAEERLLGVLRVVAVWGIPPPRPPPSPAPPPGPSPPPGA